MERPTERLELYLLGGIDLRQRSGVSDAVHPGSDRLLSQSKVVAMLALLSLAPPGRFQRRDRIVGLLWPELDQGHARAALRKALHLVRTELGPEVIATRGDEDVALLPGALWCDAAAFSAACDDGSLARALELYDGELMPGFYLTGCLEFERWLEEQRQALRERAAAAAWAMAQRLEDDVQKTLAGRWARRAVQYAGTDERVLRRAMGMLDRIGDRSGALALYDDFVKRIKATLETDPSAESVDLAEKMRAGESLRS